MKERPPPGGPVTFEELYAEHAPRVLVLVWLLGVAEAERPDVAQEVWLDVHRGLASYDPRRGSVPAWIAGIARHAVLDWHRARRRRPEVGTFAEEEPVELRTA